LIGAQDGMETGGGLGEGEGMEQGHGVVEQRSRGRSARGRETDGSDPLARRRGKLLERRDHHEGQEDDRGRANAHKTSAVLI
jgi:hypothetical protein